MTKQPNEQDKLWAKCPPGAIQKVADSAMVSRGVQPAVNLQRRKLLIATATAAGVVVLGGVGYLATRGPARKGRQLPQGGGPIVRYDFGGIYCGEVLENLPAYVANTIDDQGKIEKIKKHLELCDECRMVYEGQLVQLQG